MIVVVCVLGLDVEVFLVDMVDWKSVFYGILGNRFLDEFMVVKVYVCFLEDVFLVIKKCFLELVRDG